MLMQILFELTLILFILKQMISLLNLIDVTVTCKTKIIENFDANNKSLFLFKDFNNKSLFVSREMLSCGLNETNIKIIY